MSHPGLISHAGYPRRFLMISVVYATKLATATKTEVRGSIFVVRKNLTLISKRHALTDERVFLKLKLFKFSL